MFSINFEKYSQEMNFSTITSNLAGDFFTRQFLFSEGERVVMPRGRLSCGLKLGVKGSKAVAWLRLFAERHADKIPDKLKLFLPSCLNRKGKSIYK